MRMQIYMDIFQLLLLWMFIKVRRNYKMTNLEFQFGGCTFRQHKKRQSNYGYRKTTSFSCMNYLLPQLDVLWRSFVRLSTVTSCTDKDVYIQDLWKLSYFLFFFPLASLFSVLWTIITTNWCLLKIFGCQCLLLPFHDGYTMYMDFLEGFYIFVLIVGFVLLCLLAINLDLR